MSFEKIINHVNNIQALIYTMENKNEISEKFKNYLADELEEVLIDMREMNEGMVESIDNIIGYLNMEAK
jgi:hypothetical protein